MAQSSLDGGSGRRLYIYYRVAPGHAPTLAARVQALQQALSTDIPGLHTQRLRRPELRDGQQTWMEVYAHAQGISPVLQARIEALAAQWLPDLQGQRHVEVFVPLDDLPMGQSPVLER